MLLVLFILMLVTSSRAVPATVDQILDKGCIRRLDLVLMLDGTIDDPSMDFESVKMAVSRLIDRMGLDPILGVQISMLQYGAHVNSEFNFNARGSYTSIHFVNTAPDVPVALAQMRRIFADTSVEGSLKIGLVVTGSSSIDILSTRMQGQWAKEEGVSLIAWAVGSKPSWEELSWITLNANHAIRTTSANELHSSMMKVVDAICEYKDPCTVLEAHPDVYLSHPRDSSRFIMCQSRGTNQLQGVMGKCPRGSTFDIASRLCLPPGKFRCLIDRCSDLNITSHPIEKHCPAYWACSAGRTVEYACCPPGDSYNIGIGCGNLKLCKDKCQIGHYVIN